MNTPSNTPDPHLPGTSPQGGGPAAPPAHGEQPLPGGQSQPGGQAQPEPSGQQPQPGRQRVSSNNGQPQAGQQPHDGSPHSGQHPHGQHPDGGLPPQQGGHPHGQQPHGGHYHGGHPQGSHPGGHQAGHQQGGQQQFGGFQQPAPPMNQVAGPPPGQQAFASNQMAPLRAPRLRRRWVLELIFILLGSLAMALILFLFAYGAGFGPTVAMTLLATIPLLIVGATVLWIDRWEPEPRVLLIAAFVWGAGVSVLFAGELNAFVGSGLHGVFGGSLPAEAGPAVFGAPVVEEFFKGLGLLLIFLIRRRHFNGPVDGIVYASVIAAGFAFVENIQYFLMNQEMVGLVFILRGLASPFGHLIYTAVMGLALGWASRKGRFTWVWALPLAYAGSVLLHAAWNGFGFVASPLFENPLSFLFTQFALFNWLPLIVLGALVVWLRRQEVAVLRNRLGEYVPSGWFAGHEIGMLTSLPARRSARQWARQNGGVRAQKEMKAFQTAATSLAYARQDLHTGHTMIRAREDEMVLLHQVGVARANFRAMIGV